MKKLLKFCALIGAISVTGISAMSVVACSNEKSSVASHLYIANYENYWYPDLYQEKVDLDKLTSQYKTTVERYLDKLKANQFANVSVSQLQADFDFMQNYLMKAMSYKVVMWMKGFVDIEFDSDAWVLYRFDSDRDHLLAGMEIDELENQYVTLVNQEVEIQTTMTGFNGLKVNQTVLNDFQIFDEHWISFKQKFWRFSLS